MIIRKGFKFQLKTSGAQEKLLSQFAGCCRLVWNKALAVQKERLNQKEYCLNYPKLANLLIQWKKESEFSFLKQVHSQPLQQTLMNLDKALKEAFDKKNPKRFPRFKKKGHQDSFRYPQGFKVDEKNNRCFLPKIGWIRYRNSRDITGTPKNLTVSRVNGKWFVSVQTEQTIEEPIHISTKIIGVDMGIANFATLSDGTFYAPINSYRTNEFKLKRAQKALSRKVKFSHNWKKQRIKVSKIHQRVASIRKDFLHKTSTFISKNHAMIVMEDLRVSNMSRSASGTVETPGQCVKAKSGLNKSILDQGWYLFRQQLEYKQAWRGGNVLTVAPQNTSRCCSICGFVSKNNRKTQEKFCCEACGHMDHADVNAAKNILAAGHAVLACGEKVLLGHSMKQEPTEVALVWA